MKESRTSSIILIVSLILFMVGGYTIIYFRFVDKVKDSVSPYVEEEKITLTNEELDDLLETIPNGIGITVEEEYKQSYNVYKDNFNSRDGYSGKYVFTNNIDERILINNIFYKNVLNPKPSFLSIMVNGEKVFCNENVASYDEVKKDLLDKYNKELDNIEFNAIPSYSGVLVISDSLDYICSITLNGTKEFEVMNKINKYEAKGEKLFIYSKSAIIKDNSGSALIYKDSISNKVIQEISPSETNSNYMEAAKNYVENNWKNFSTFKHTFIKTEDGYKWYSSELA